MPVRRRPDSPRAAFAPSRNNRARSSNPTTLELARACARESTTGAWIDSGSLLFLAGCAGSVLAGCVFHMERFVAHFDSFESFVRALLA